MISKQEALARYEVTVQWLYRILDAEGIKPMLINGKAYFPKNDLDRLLPPRVMYNPNEWYDAYDLMRSEGFTRKYISDFIRRKEVPCRRPTISAARKSLVAEVVILFSLREKNGTMLVSAGARSRQVI